MTASRLRGRLVAGAVAVALVALIDSTGVAPRRVSIVVDDVAQLAAGLLAVACCGWAAIRTTGVERTWRRLMAFGMAGWSVGQLIWSWYQIFADTPLPSPSWADVGYLSLPAFALAALLAIGAETKSPSQRRGRPSPGVGRTRLVLALDGLVVVGSLLILTWYTALGAVVAAGAPTGFAFAVAIAYPVTDVMLVVLVVLLLATRPVASRLRPQLGLLGLGLVALSLSDSIFAYLVASGAAQMPPAANIGFIAGPVLIALAALTTSVPDVEHRHAADGRLRGWAHLLLPYVPLAATCVQMVVQQAAGQPFDSVEVYCGAAVLALVLARQMITLIENTVLLDRVSDAQRRLHFQAFHDPLTGLANRALFHRHLETAVELSRTERRRVALLFLDLDDFKVVNDSLGHLVGDQVLRAVAARLRSAVRAGDTVARLGGDEFAIIVAGEHDDPDHLARRILAGLRSPFEIGEHTLAVGASIGVATLDATQKDATQDATQKDAAQPDVTADGLLRRADAAMYAGKRAGKGVLVVDGAGADGGEPDGIDGDDVPALLARALANPGPGAGLEVHYQPIIRLSDGAWVAVEALARWNHPVLGWSSTAVFVDATERSALARSLDDHTLDRACRDLATQPTASGLSLHVNVSADRLGSEQLEVTVGQALRRYGVEPRRLVLEITGTAGLADLEQVTAGAHRLRRLGVRLALDDVGAGFTSLAHLLRLPIDMIKLDHTLTAVDPRAGDPRAGDPRAGDPRAGDTRAGDTRAGGTERPVALCRALLGASAELDITVVAGAVERPEQAAALAALGCEYAQGHLYGQPAPLPAPWQPSRLGAVPAQRTTGPDTGQVGPAVLRYASEHTPLADDRDPR